MSLSGGGRLQVGVHESATYMDARVVSAMHENEKRSDKARLRVKDKADRATAELVLDPRTLRILGKLVTNNHLASRARLHQHGQGGQCVLRHRTASVLHLGLSRPLLFRRPCSCVP